MSKYIRYELKNVQPIRITDDSASQSGQGATLKYIPGTAIRGYVVNILKDKDDFDTIKNSLFSDDVRFLNAYYIAEDMELIPSPKGFYEDKQKKEGEKDIDNVVIDGKFKPGYKRASLGDYCYFKDGCINYYSIDTGSDLKIKVNINGKEKRNVFRLDHIKSNYNFVGYIAVEDETMCNCIADCFNDYIYIGNARSQGLGKCKVISNEVVEQAPFLEYQQVEDVKDYCYMILLSNTVMLGDDGEPEGINVNALASILGISCLEVERCATSTINICGYNRKIGNKTPSMIVYEKGSVFKLNFRGEIINKDCIRALIDKGVGINKNVGMGRVLIVNEYEKIRKKASKNYSKKYEVLGKNHGDEDKKALALVARNYYKRLIKHAMSKATIAENDAYENLKINESQKGRVESIILQNRYDVEEARRILDKFFEHEDDKEKSHKKQNDKKSIKGLKDFIYYVLDSDIEHLFDIESKNRDTIFEQPKHDLLNKEEIQRLKFDYILMRMRMHRKGEK